MPEPGNVLLAPSAGAKADVREAREILDDADVVLVPGGTLKRAGMAVLGRQHLLPLLRERVRRGTVFVGLSAGSIMLCRQWVRWRDPKDDSTAEAFACMGFAPVLCDTHGESENWEELLALLRIGPPEAAGYGIPSGAGTVRHAGRTASCDGRTGDEVCYARRRRHQDRQLKVGGRFSWLVRMVGISPKCAITPRY